MKNIYRALLSILANPIRSLALGMALPVAGFVFQVLAPFLMVSNSGQGSLMSPPTALVLAGQEVYVNEGCQYCHSQNLRPLAFDQKFFNKTAEYGHFPLAEAAEYDYDSPSVAGSMRIGPDLSRTAARKSATQLEALLQGKSGTPAAAVHDMGYLFEEEPGALLLSWKVRAMIASGAYLSDGYLNSAENALQDQSKGSALIAFLLDRGKRQKDFAGKYYRD